MARIRSIKPEFPQSESMGNVSRDARLTFLQLWTIADDEGRLRGNSRMLASLLFPYDNDAPELIDGWLFELEKEGCIIRYKADGQSYVQICKWLIHQKIDKPSKSKIPEFTEASRILANPSLRIKDQGSKDQGEDKTSSTEPKAAQQTSPVELVAIVAIPLQDKTEFGISEEQIAEWSSAYPSVDVLQQLRNMRQWSIANPTKKKTRRGVMSFCNSWLMKAQDRPPVRGSPPTQQSTRDASRMAAANSIGLGGRQNDSRTIDADCNYLPD